ncbi:MAG: hypothetical protein HC871_14900 [Rhizobiales bacterium]|nr:hypothetical protein [Hyphomicrobiales bacterium]
MTIDLLVNIDVGDLQRAIAFYGYCARLVEAGVAVWPGDRSIAEDPPSISTPNVPNSSPA